MLEKIETWLERQFSTVKPAPAGIYHYQAPENAEIPFRLHLRIEEDGSGILILNASTVLHLNRTAAEYAFHLVHNIPEQKTAKLVAEKYEVEKEQALEDYRQFIGKLDTLLRTPDLDPVSYLDIERINPYSEKISAPYRLDCAITYQVSDLAQEENAPIKRVDRELSTQEWKSIFDKAWQAGIPHIVFTGGEPTKRSDLIELIQYAENMGMVTGLLTDGLKLGQKQYLNDLLQSGLDHAMLLCNPQEKGFWNSLKIIMPADLAVLIHITIDNENIDNIENLLVKLASYGVKELSLSSSDPNFAKQLQQIKQYAVENGFSILWDLPVPYSNCNPIAMELAQSDAQMVDGAGKAWLYVEPDGDVLPAQGVNQVLGNLLHDPWQRIWGRKK